MVENPDVVDAALAGDRTGDLHRRPPRADRAAGGSTSPSTRAGRITAPMETLGDPALQRWFERTRADVRGPDRRPPRGPPRAARRRCGAASRSGSSADRDITGGGMEVPFFGAPAPLPVGPALLAIETGVPLYLASVWRVGARGYRGRLDADPGPATARAASGSRRRSRRRPAAFERVDRERARSSGWRSSSRSGRTSRRSSRRRADARPGDGR